MTQGRVSDHLVCAPVAADLESARLEWERAYRDLEEVTGDAAARQRIDAQLATLLAELRKRIGGSFTLVELAEVYVDADRWARDVLAEEPEPGWTRTLTLVEGAAFHLYARGALDYTP